MHRTIFTTPVVNTVLRAFSVGFLRLTGWKLDGALPAGHDKCVLIAAPHTSNWDLPYTLMVAFALRINIHWMGKAQIFRWPFGALMRWLGGIAVDRSQSNNLVAASAQALREAGVRFEIVPGVTAAAGWSAMAASTSDTPAATATSTVAATPSPSPPSWLTEPGRSPMWTRPPASTSAR